MQTKKLFSVLTIGSVLVKLNSLSSNWALVDNRSVGVFADGMCADFFVFWIFANTDVHTSPFSLVMNKLSVDIAWQFASIVSFNSFRTCFAGKLSMETQIDNNYDSILV